MIERNKSIILSAPPSYNNEWQQPGGGHIYPVCKIVKTAHNGMKRSISRAKTHAPAPAGYRWNAEEANAPVLRTLYRSYFIRETPDCQALLHKDVQWIRHFCPTFCLIFRRHRRGTGGGYRNFQKSWGFSENNIQKQDFSFWFLPVIRKNKSKSEKSLSSVKWSYNHLTEFFDCFRKKNICFFRYFPIISSINSISFEF